jgi:hypothetical protein
MSDVEMANACLWRRNVFALVLIGLQRTFSSAFTSHRFRSD